MKIKKYKKNGVKAKKEVEELFKKCILEVPEVAETIIQKSDHQRMMNVKRNRRNFKKPTAVQKLNHRLSKRYGIKWYSQGQDIKWRK